MRASYQWIRDYLENYDESPEEMAEALTFSGNEVEDVEAVGEDHVLDVGVTSNRVDCLCHLGLARELSALRGVPLLPPQSDPQARGGATSEQVSVEVIDSERCPRYTAQVIEGVTVGPSPAWLVERLETLGLRSVNNVVDITNFVLLETNQPLHAFDLDRLASASLIVRRAAAEEEFTAINGRSYTLHPDDLVIADGERVVALAGVMGGLDTEVSEATTRVLLESASFDSVSVRRSSRRHGLSTDSSFRFERRVDRAGAFWASRRAAALILELCGGRLCQDPVDLGGDPAPRESITLRLPRLEAVCGISIPKARVCSLLEGLECQLVDEGEALQVTPPSFRLDLSREIDLIEEVIRLHGLDAVPLESRMTVLIPRQSPLRVAKERIRDAMVALRFCETVTPNFIPDGIASDVAILADGASLRVRNPVRSGEGHLRRSLIPSLLQVRKHNQDHGNEGCRFFEISNLHFATTAGEVPLHVLALGALMDGDLRDIRAVAEEIAELLGVGLSCNPGPSSAGAEGGHLILGERRVGFLGYPSAELITSYHLKSRPAVLELDLEALASAGEGHRTHRELPRFPSSDRDLAVVVPEALPFRELEDSLRALDLAQLESLSFVDEYRGRQIGAGRKSLAVRLVFRASDRTLTSEEVDAATQRAITELKARFGAELRGGA